MIYANDDVLHVNGNDFPMKDIAHPTTFMAVAMVAARVARTPGTEVTRVLRAPIQPNTVEPNAPKTVEWLLDELVLCHIDVGIRVVCRHPDGQSLVPADTVQERLPFDFGYKFTEGEFLPTITLYSPRAWPTYIEYSIARSLQRRVLNTQRPSVATPKIAKVRRSIRMPG